MKKQQPVLAFGLTPALQRTMRFASFKPGEVNRAREVSVTAAGKCVNVGLALSILGENAYVTGFNGGAAGRILVADVIRRGGWPAFTRIDAETRTCTTVIDEATGSVSELVQEAPPVTERDLARLNRKLLRLLPACSAMTISGNLPATFPDDAYETIARKAASLGIPWLIDSHKAPLLATLPCRPLLAKMNRLELDATFGLAGDDEKDRLDALRALTKAGARWALMTDGAAPALLLSAEGELVRLVPAPLASVASPIGSGDCTTAGTIHALLHGLDMAEAVAYGLACGTANARTWLPAFFEKPSGMDARIETSEEDPPTGRP